MVHLSSTAYSQKLILVNLPNLSFAIFTNYFFGCCFVRCSFFDFDYQLPELLIGDIGLLGWLESKNCCYYFDVLGIKNSFVLIRAKSWYIYRKE